MSIDANLELNLGGDTGGIDLSQIQFPNRPARQLLSGTSQARPNLGGVVLAQPGIPLQGTSQARPNLDGVVLAQPGVPLQGNYQAPPNFGGDVLAQPGVLLQGNSQARPNFGGDVLAQPGVPLQGNYQAPPNFGGVVLAQSGVPLQTALPTGQQSVQVSTTSYTNVRLGHKTIVTFYSTQTDKKK